MNDLGALQRGRLRCGRLEGLEHNAKIRFQVLPSSSGIAPALSGTWHVRTLRFKGFRV